jgi:hypothetical protein
MKQEHTGFQIVPWEGEHYGRWVYVLIIALPPPIPPSVNEKQQNHQHSQISQHKTKFGALKLTLHLREPAHDFIIWVCRDRRKYTQDNHSSFNTEWLHIACLKASALMDLVVLVLFRILMSCGPLNWCASNNCEATENRAHGFKRAGYSRLCFLVIVQGMRVPHIDHLPWIHAAEKVTVDG